MIIDSNSFRLDKKGAFIAFEGINGCGKSTLQKNVAEALSTVGHSIVTTREPGGTPLGLGIRKLLLDWEGEQKSPLTELLLFGADRSEHVESVIKPALKRGDWVLCDRYIFSTLAFQGAGRGLDLTLLSKVNSIATGDLLPDLVVLMDLNPNDALKRIEKRNAKLAAASKDNPAHQPERDSFEEEELSFHNRIREGFLKCARESTAPFLVLDANASKEVNLAQTLRVLEV